MSRRQLPDEPLDLATTVLDLARKGEDLEVYLQHTTGTTVHSGAGGEIRRVDQSHVRGLAVRVFAECRVGFAASTDLRPDGVAAIAALARRNAAAGDVDPDNVPPEPEHPAAVPDLLHPSLTAFTLDDTLRLTAELARAVDATDDRVGVDTVQWHHERVETAVASTRGVHVAHIRGHAELVVDTVGEDDFGRAAEYASWAGRNPYDVDVDALASQAVQRTLRLLGPRALAVDGLPVVLDPAVVADLLAVIGRACTGGVLLSGRSPFAGRRDERLATPTVRLIDDGTATASPTSAAYDGEGVPRRATVLVDGGVLVGALHSTATARATGDGARSTGNARRATHKAPPRVAPTNLTLAPTDSYGNPDAVHLQQLSGAGSGISAITGRVDVGALGWLSRGGEPAGPLPTLPLSTDLVTFLSAIVAVADDAHPVPYTPVTAPTVVCDPALLGSATRRAGA